MAWNYAMSTVCGEREELGVELPVVYLPYIMELKCTPCSVSSSILFRSKVCSSVLCGLRIAEAFIT